MAAGCGLTNSTAPGTGALRTFAFAKDRSCTAFGLTDPVRGTFQGDSKASDPAWLVAADGRHLSVIWPDGFSLRFEPAAVLYSDRGQAVARAGEPTELGQVRWSSAAGTYADPYYATGILFGGCYVR